MKGKRLKQKKSTFQSIAQCIGRRSRKLLFVAIAVGTVCYRRHKRGATLDYSLWSIQVESVSNNVSPQSSDDYAFTEMEMKVLEKHDCFVVENMCIAQGIDWFFFHGPEPSNHQNSFVLEADWNPDLRLPFQIVVNASSSSSSKNCQWSSIPNHLIATGQFIDMAGPVYIRLVAGLFELWQDLATESQRWGSLLEDPSPFVQLHIHIPGNKTELLPTMTPLLAGFSANPIRNILDLVLVNDKDKPSDNCQCLSRLAFCGYFDANARDRIMKRKRKRQQQRLKKQEARQEIQQHADNNLQPQRRLLQQQQALLPKAKRIKRLKPGLQVGRSKGDDVDPPIPWDAIRNFTRQGAFRAYPHLESKISKWKRSLLKSTLSALPGTNKTWVYEQATKHLNSYKLIGFSQRGTRRRWFNLPDILQRCSQKGWTLRQIICVEINLDTPSGRDPEQQVMMHGGLDALLGIHGSQQVHAIWMPDGSYILELLPHLVGTWGQWTQSTDRRTSSGKIFNSTALNHVGYPLDASSIPDCQPHDPAVCNDEPRWDNRDFFLDPTVAESFLQKFLVSADTVSATTKLVNPCSHFESLADQEFVLYHVSCINDDSEELEHRAYFRARESFAHLNEMGSLFSLQQQQQQYNGR